jgi:aminoglycoside phosphotransferase (APT) family kinase protein
MSLRKMHVDEVDTSVSLVARLLTMQFPQWSDLPIDPVDSAGTDNALYRLGNDMVVRLPRIHWAVGQVEKEHQWLPRLAPYLPLAIPVPLAKGVPAEGYPWHWSVYKWLEGKDATVDRVADQRQAATDLAQFVHALQRIAPEGVPLAMDQNSRGLPLVVRDNQTREAIAALRSLIDTDAVTEVWEAALHGPEWDRKPVLFHGDLLPGNLLVERGRLSAVIDFSCLGVGDPACDLMIAWGMFADESREMFRTALSIDDATWTRGRAHALSQALIFIPYYLQTNPVGVSRARRTIDEVLADFSARG